jgi:hypothetical protein
MRKALFTHQINVRSMQSPRGREESSNDILLTERTVRLVPAQDGLASNWMMDARGSRLATVPSAVGLFISSLKITQPLELLLLKSILE